MPKLALLGGPKTITHALHGWPVIDDADRSALLATLDSGKWGTLSYPDGNSQATRFEREWAAAHNAKHAIAVNSGSAALEICMRSINLKPGNEVITTPYTFIATTTCILNANALPVYVDVDLNTFNIDVSKVEAAITPRTRAILPVHFGGDFALMQQLRAIADRHNLALIEDAAHAHGASLTDGRFAAHYGDAAIFSFQESKNLSCGEGGAVLTNSDELADMARSLRSYGRKVGQAWYGHYFVGWNGRMNEFSATVLRSQLPKMASQAQHRMRNVQQLTHKLAGLPGLVPTQPHPEQDRRSIHLLMFRYLEDHWDGLPREKFLEALSAEGVPAGAGYPCPIYEYPLFSEIDFASRDSVYMIGRDQPMNYARFKDLCPHAERICRHEAVWIHHAALLGPPSDMDLLADAIFKVYQHRGDLLISAAK